MLRYIKRRILKFNENKIKADFLTLKIKIRNYELLKPNIWRQIYDCLKELYRIYPEIELGILNLIEVRRDLKNKAAVTNFYFENLEYIDTKQIGIFINEKIFKYPEYLKDMFLNTDADVSSNNFVKWIIAHEFGHLIDITYSLKYKNAVRLMKKDDINDFLKNLTLSNEILYSIFYGYNEFDEISEKRLMSEYSTKSNCETFAEAVACGYFKSKNKLAQKILEEFEKRREKK